MVAPKEVSQAIHLGHLPPQEQLHLSVSLPYAHPVELQNFVDSVSDPKSPNYRQFIKPEEIGVRFGLPMTVIQKTVLPMP